MIYMIYESCYSAFEHINSRGSKTSPSKRKFNCCKCETLCYDLLTL